MTPDELYARYRTLLDPDRTDPGEGTPAVDVSGAPARFDVREQVRRAFEEHPDAGFVRLLAGAEFVGKVRGDEAADPDGGHRAVGGDSAMLGLAGHPGAVSAIRLVCADVNCAAEQYVNYVDDPLPVCEVCGGWTDCAE
ncbi:hypothetical protein [Kitasatospora sp. NPDC057500]|uniref:hypothetical protein n=1 Tax=Kitasatospora sp. NPDC057500 TaxID=3346151 RepID=UPI00367CDCAB